MLQLFRKLFNSFMKKPDVWFFYAFLFTSTLSIRKVLFCYPLGGGFNEYTGIYLYLSDIFLLLTITVWLLSLCNKYHFLSTSTSLPRSTPILSVKNISPQYECSTWNILQSRREIFLWAKKAYQQVIHSYVLFFPLFIAIFSSLSILWSNNQEIAFFRSIKLAGLVLLFFYTLKNVPRGTFLKKSLQIIISVSVVQSLIGIIQFLIQHSLGLSWLKESIISPQLTGVAKIILDGHLYVRAYGLFPHPNMLGGFLVLSLIASLAYSKTFHACSVAKKCSTWNIWERFRGRRTWNISFASRMKHFKRNEMTAFRVIILVQGLALLLTFSKSAILGLFIGFFYLYIHKCSTWNIFSELRNKLMFRLPEIPPFKTHPGRITGCLKMFHVEHLKRKLFLVIGIVILILTIAKPDVHSLLFKSLQEREFYLNVSPARFAMQSIAGGRGTETDIKTLALGVGSGQFVINVNSENITNIQPWQYQPVHNVFLLILNEFGIVVFFLFLFFLYKLFRPGTNVPRGTFVETTSGPRVGNVYLKAILVSFIFIMLFDHYFWDIQQGQILLWLLFGFIAGTSKEQ